MTTSRTAETRRFASAGGDAGLGTAAGSSVSDADAEAPTVLPGDGGVRRILLDGVDKAAGTEPGRFQAQGAGAGADVPDDAIGAQLQARQGQGPHLALGDQPPVGLALQKTVVRQTEADGRPARAPQGEHDQIGIGKVPVGGGGWGEVGDHLLVRPAQVGHDRQAAGVPQAFLEQQPGDAVGAVGRAGEDSQVRPSITLPYPWRERVGERGSKGDPHSDLWRPDR